MGRVQNIAILSSILVVSITIFGLLSYLVGFISHVKEDPKCDRASFGRRIQANRGFIRDSQENTIKAILDAYDAGYEPAFDVRATRDGHLVLFADKNAERMCEDGRKVIHELKLEEVKELRLRSTINDWRYRNEGEIPTYKDTLAAICSKGNEDRSFQVTYHARDRAPRLSDHDQEAAENLVKLFKESPCKSSKVIFGVGQPRVGKVVKAQLEDASMSNIISFFMEPNTWVLGEAFWIKARTPFVLSGATVLDFQHVFWSVHNESIQDLKKAGWCMGSFGKDSVDEAFDADVWRANVPGAAWDLIGDELRSWQNQTDIDSYEPNYASFWWAMFLTVTFAVIIISILPNLICLVKRPASAKVAPDPEGNKKADEENPADTAAPAPAQEDRAEEEKSAPAPEEEKEAEPAPEPAEEAKADDAAPADPAAPAGGDLPPL